MGLGGKTVGMWCRGRGGEGEVVYRRAMGHTATTRIMGLAYVGSGSIAGQGKGVCTPKSFSWSGLLVSAGKSGRCTRQNST